jgi:hypothetical protein
VFIDISTPWQCQKQKHQSIATAALIADRGIENQRGDMLRRDEGRVITVRGSRPRASPFYPLRRKK